jgi:agmatinase
MPVSAENGSNVPLDDSSFYANVFSFMGRPLSRTIDGCDAVVMGFPYDLATTGRSGTRFGPLALRQASANLKWEERRFPWDFPVFDRLAVIDYGDLRYGTGDSEDFLAQTQAQAAAIVGAGKHLISFGGDHFVTLPLLRAHAATHGPLALIHFDAHTDTYQQSEKYDHGSMFYHAPREGLIDPDRSVQVGIRTDYTREGHGFLVLDAPQVNDLSTAEVVDAIRRRVGDGPAYLSFDIDCLDPAFAPGTGTPVAGGLSSGKALDILHGIRDLNIVGFDLMEVSPPYDHADVTALAGATIALQFLYMLASRR